MNLLDESFQNKEEKKGNTTKTIVLVAIILVVLIIIGILAALVTIKGNTLKMTINEQTRNDLIEILSFEKDNEGNDIIYVPIKQIAKDLGYESYNGEYARRTETNTKCYIISEQEAANFELDSNKIYKLDLTTNDKDNYEYVYSDKPVKAINGVLYATTDAIEKAFNVSFEYDLDKNIIQIYTLPYLIEAWSPYVLDKGYEQISETFANQKAILKNMIVVEKNNSTGIIDTSGNPILESKYETIKYLPNVGNGEDFIVKSNGKVGIMSSNKKTKISIDYDDIKLLDIDEGLYIATKSRKSRNFRHFR